MSNPISPYLSFTALFDYTQSEPTLVLTDTGTYPAGVPNLVKGNFTIKQPDGLTRTNTDFTQPDVSWNGTSLNAFSIPLRLSCEGQVQLGTYTITYTVQATGYDQGYITKTFSYTLVAPTEVLTTSMDVFTPNLSVTDSTNYVQPGFTDVVSRTITALVSAVSNTLTTTGSTLSLAYNGSYYDSNYTLTLSGTVTYTGNPLTYLSAKFPLYVQQSADAYTPPSCSSMINALTAYQNTVESTGCGATEALNTATALLNAINTSLGAGSYSQSLYQQILQFEAIVTNGQYAPTHTNLPIAAYVYNCGSGGTGGGGGVSSVTVAFTVGDPGYNLNGQSSAVFSSLATGTGNAKQIVIFTKGGVNVQPGLAYTFTPSTGTITLLNGDTFVTGDQIYIFAIYSI